MKPSQRYNEFLRQPDFVSDPAQQHAVSLLDGLLDELTAEKPGGWRDFTRLIPGFGAKRPVQKGLYFWGGVGRGKTFLMDIFFEALPLERKTRIHFHRFMKLIHDELAIAPKGSDPLKDIAAKLTAGAEVLCLDEFVVTDIGDAMLIGRLLDALFERGTVLVTTSNVPPHGLYKDGLQRDNFLPAIALLEQYCEVYNLDGGTDYRMKGLADTNLYLCPHDDGVHRHIEDYVTRHLVGGQKNADIEINDRKIRYHYCGEDTIWFQFDQLCKTTRSRLDYLEIAQQYGTVILTDIEVMGDQSVDVARRFISLIDVLYDHRVKFICSAAAAHDALYPKGRLAFEFQRTASRLREMQSQEYMSQAHQI